MRIEALIDFSGNGISGSIRNSVVPLTSVQRTAKYRIANREKVKATMRRYNKANQEANKARCKAYREARHHA